MTTVDKTQLFFILGRERSGTTLLRSILNGQKEIYIPPESPFIMHLKKKYGRVKNINTNDLLTDLINEPYFSLWGIEMDVLKQKLDLVEPKLFQDLCIEILLSKSDKNISIVGDKNPINILFTKELMHAFSSAKFIWIVRDYRAQVNSMLKVNFETKNVASLAERWKKYNQKVLELQRVYPSKICLIRYEDLVEKPSETLQKIANFLGFIFDVGAIERPESDEIFVKEHHLSLSQEMNTKHVSEWKNELNQIQIRICESICGKLGESFGYEKTTSRLGYPERLTITPSIIFGALYISFIRLMYSLPLSLRMVINRKFIYPNFMFWKESKASIKHES